MDHRLTLGLIVAGLVAAAAVLVVRPWESGGSRSRPDFAGAELAIQGGSHTERRVVSPDELIAAYPLPIQLPAHVPDGYSLSSVTYLEPPPGLDRLSFANSLQATYRGSGSAFISLEERPGSGIGTTDVPTEPVVVRGSEGWYHLMDRAEGTEQLSWSRCGRVFMLSSGPRGVVSKDELLRVAESVGPDACEPDLRAGTNLRLPPPTAA